MFQKVSGLSHGKNPRFFIFHRRSVDTTGYVGIDPVVSESVIVKLWHFGEVIDPGSTAPFIVRNPFGNILQGQFA